MPSWVIAGASRGIGLEFVNQLSANSANEVFGIIRSAPNPELSELASSRNNLHIIQADVSDASSLSRAAQEVAARTGNKLDVLIHNACSTGLEFRFYPATAFTDKPDELKKELDACVCFRPLNFCASSAVKLTLSQVHVNLLGAIYTINSFLPLIRNGQEKKIVYITSPSGDAKFTRACSVTVTLGYSISKAGMNLMIAKYAAELAGEGIKTLALSPGWVDTDGSKSPSLAVQSNDLVRWADFYPVTSARDMAPTEEYLQLALQAFQKLNPNITRLLTTEESVQQQLEVINKLTAEQSGLALSHHGDENWL
ncbi:uncharacterized protein KD926_000112 [Aspergillus affinis]|uniref:uncharacterized protein n=1 Tax=Aspergillus affinis TaxID=1070780 RepID=UPI0022FE104A|nr:uncharacterized protein KD926_000112 [Aspergillus affinis]KAI9037696.1 hypothetical protein KD926_000112 [Aspergillus affinis]